MTAKEAKTFAYKYILVSFMCEIKKDKQGWTIDGFTENDMILTIGYTDYLTHLWEDLQQIYWNKFLQCKGAKEGSAWVDVLCEPIDGEFLVHDIELTFPQDDELDEFKSVMVENLSPYYDHSNDSY